MCCSEDVALRAIVKSETAKMNWKCVFRETEVNEDRLSTLQNSSAPCGAWSSLCPMLDVGGSLRRSTVCSSVSRRTDYQVEVRWIRKWNCAVRNWKWRMHNRIFENGKERRWIALSKETYILGCFVAEHVETEQMPNYRGRSKNRRVFYTKTGFLTDDKRHEEPLEMSMNEVGLQIWMHL